jgi:hypothetical protein
MAHRRRKRRVVLGRHRKRSVKRRRVNRRKLPSGAAFARVIARKTKNKLRRLHAKRRLLSLYPASGKDHDEILVDMVRQARKSGGYLSTNDRVHFQDEIHSANRHGMSNKDAEELLRHLGKFGR